MAPATELSLTLRPRSRIDFIRVSDLIREHLAPYRWSVYISYHTTAGYLDPALAERLRHDVRKVSAFIHSCHSLFPPGADYFHDRLQLRTELDDAARDREPRNADAHLTYIGCGLSSCVTYPNRPELPVYFVELDGVIPEGPRRRHTSVIGFNRSRRVDRFAVSIPVSTHPIDSVNLRDPALGLFERLQHEIRRQGIRQGRIDIVLEPDEVHAGLTVNEYETLLMQHDLAEVLRNPLRYMAERGRHMLEDPWAIPRKFRGYAKFDFVQVLNRFLDSCHLSGTVVERALQKFMAYPAARFLRMKRSLSLPITAGGSCDCGKVVAGRYQSPILIQWGRPERRRRRLRVALISFE